MAGENGRGSDSDPAIKLDGLGDVQRELAKLYRQMKGGSIDRELGGSLVFCLAHLAKVMADRRDSKHKKQLATLWAEHQKTLPADAVGH